MTYANRSTVGIVTKLFTSFDSTSVNAEEMDAGALPVGCIPSDLNDDNIFSFRIS